MSISHKAKDYISMLAKRNVIELENGSFAKEFVAATKELETLQKGMTEKELEDVEKMIYRIKSIKNS